MAYTKQTWVDRIVQYARRYTKADIDADTVELTPEPGTITQAGTSITASRMNNIENEIEFLSNRYATTGGSGNAYTLTITNSNYNYNTGHTVVFTANATNTASATLNVNGLGAKTFKKEIEGSLIDLFYGDIANGVLYEAVYNGTYFILKRPSRRDEFYQSTSTGNDSYSISLSNEMIYNFSVYNGLTVRMKADVSNVGAATLSVNGASAKTIRKATRQGIVDLSDGDIQAGGLYTLIYDGTYFQLQNPTQTSGVTGTITGDNTANRVINLGFTPKQVILWANGPTYKSMSITINSGLTGLHFNTDSNGTILQYTSNELGAEIIENGFKISNGVYNSSSYTTYYSAF